MTGRGNGPVAALADVAARLHQHTQRQTIAVGVEDGDGVVLRAAIYDDDLIGRPRLREQAVEQAADRVAFVEHGGNDSDELVGHKHVQ